MWKLLFIMMSLSALGTGCEKEKMSANDPVGPSPVPGSGAKTYLALGDSYTIGQGVSAQERFPHLTATGLRSQGISIQDPQYIAATGWTTVNLQQAIAAQNPSPGFDLVTLLIGVNDQYQRRDTADYRVRFTQLLTTAITLAGGRKERVFVLSIPDYSATPFVAPNDKQRVTTEIGWFNAINREVTLQRQVSYVDITPLTREAAQDPSLLASDNLHYSAKAHQKWADLLVPLMKAAVQ